MTILYLVLFAGFAAVLASAAAYPFEVSSTNEHNIENRRVAGGEKLQDPNDAKYDKLARESFNKYRETNPGGQIDLKELKVTKVTTQVVAGTMTRIDFTVLPTNGDEITCHSKIWEQPWLNKKEITVNCDISQQKSIVKRQVPGGEVEKDTNDQQYKKLAQESIEKFSQTYPGGPINVKEIKVTKVTYQVVSGSFTRLTFTVEPTNGEKFTCHSEVWEQPWLKKKEITVNCDINQHKSKVKRQVPGGEVEKDANDQQYKKLAQESIEKFSQTYPGGPINVKEIKVTKVTYQVVSGSLTRITFTVEPANGEKFTCHSEVLEQTWLKKKEITVNCDINQQKSKVKRQVLGGEVEKDANDQQYKKLAQESIEKFSQTYPGGPINVKEIKVTKVTYQVVSGSLTRITFTVEPTNGEKFTCHSEVLEQTWLKKKEITVNCDINQQKSKVKRQVPGGEVEKDTNDQQYKKLAQESIEKFSQTYPGGPINVKEIKVTKVTYQVVAGSLTRVTFTVEPTNGEKFTCHSEVWEQPWLKKKEITVNCDINQQKSKVKRQVPGGEVEKDANDQQYKKLAQESIEKFSQTYPGGPINVKEIKVTKVTYQVVSGSLTRITFTVEPANGEKFTCHSEVLEQTWLKKKEITVNCDINQQKSKVKRQVLGGEVEKDANDQQYKKLAQESIEKFSQTYPGGPINVKEIKVTKVTYQVVSGSLTRITFTVEPTNGEKFTCHSEVLEQTWLNKKDINVDCDLKRK